MDGIFSTITKGVQRYLAVMPFVIVLGFCQEKLTVKTQDDTSSIANLEKKVKKLTSELENIDKEFKTIKQNIEINSSDVKTTAGSVVELNKKVESINNELINVLTKIEQLSREISEIKVNLLDYEQKINKAQPTSNKDSEQIYEPKKDKLIDENILDNIDFYEQELSSIKKDISEIKETQKMFYPKEIKDPNLRRIVTSPYLVISTLFISIFALIVAF